MSIFPPKAKVCVLAVCFAVFAHSKPAAALNLGIMAGGVGDGLSQGVDEAIAEREANQLLVQERQMERLQSGIPELTRMRMLERNSDQIFARLMRVFREAGRPTIPSP